VSATARDGQDVPNLLRAAYAQHVTKRTAIAADVPVETARNWVRGRATPSASTLLRMAARCDRVASALERLLNDRRANRAADPVLPMAGGPTAADRGGKA
jgi:hypothetical protein